MDLLIGIAGAVLIRLLVYAKGKNAKKYRKGMEYGSARWGTSEYLSKLKDELFDTGQCLPRIGELAKEVCSLGVGKIIEIHDFCFFFFHIILQSAV